MDKHIVPGVVMGLFLVAFRITPELSGVEEAQEETFEQEVDRLIDGCADLTNRDPLGSEEAFATLEGLGDRAVAALERRTPDPNSAIRQRMTQILDRLRNTLACQDLAMEVVMDPPRITFKEFHTPKQPCVFRLKIRNRGENSKVLYGIVRIEMVKLGEVYPRPGVGSTRLSPSSVFVHLELAFRGFCHAAAAAVTKRLAKAAVFFRRGIVRGPDEKSVAAIVSARKLLSFLEKERWAVEGWTR